MLLTCEVRWDCRLLAALMTSAGPTIHPTRQPVIAKDFATPPSRTVVSASSGTALSTEVKGMPS